MTPSSSRTGAAIKPRTVHETGPNTSAAMASRRNGGEDASSTDEGETTTTTIGGQEVTSVRVPSTTISLTPSRDSGVRGTTTLTETPGGLEVKLDMQNLIGE